MPAGGTFVYFCDLLGIEDSGTGSRSVIAGPFTTFPKRSKRDPWQGQSHDFSVSFQSTMQ